MWDVEVATLSAAFPTRLLRACMSPLNAIRRTEPLAASASVEFGVAKDSTKRVGRGLIRRIGSGKALPKRLRAGEVGLGTDTFPHDTRY